MVHEVYHEDDILNVAKVKDLDNAFHSGRVSNVNILSHNVGCKYHVPLAVGGFLVC